MDAVCYLIFTPSRPKYIEIPTISKEKVHTSTVLIRHALHGYSQCCSSRTVLAKAKHMYLLIHELCSGKGELNVSPWCINPFPNDKF